jgi:excisionase family DNA binding protein
MEIVERPGSSAASVVPVEAPVSLDGLPLVLTISEAAVVLRVSRTTAYKLAEEWRTSEGRSGLPVIRLGRRLVVRRADLAQLLEGAPPAA